MKATLLYRIASVIFLIFAAGHTFGFLKFRPPTPEGQAVWTAMNTVRFRVRNSDFSYGGFYVGFGLMCTVYLLFSAFLAWHLGNLAATHAQAIGSLGWVFFVVQLAVLALSWVYFFAAPAALSALAAACLGWAAWLEPSG